MKLLLDTHVLLWAAGEPPRLPPRIRTLLENPENQLSFSTASIWEIVIKRSAKRPDFRVDPRVLRRHLLDNGYLELTITSAHALAVSLLPPIHQDPFDRILVAQSFSEGMLLITVDPQVEQYLSPGINR